MTLRRITPITLEHDVGRDLPFAHIAHGDAAVLRPLNEHWEP
jgi:hypothetical protein